MSKIKKLSPHVADLIAAGEVVERPCSVVKELIENGLDAGATAITVEIQGGGLRYIRITDNGAGMDESDAKLAFHRHATSKLETGRDLEAIGTLGFRGEALAAIAAVSRIDLLTREPEAPMGCSVTVEAGQIVDLRPAGCPPGTTIIVRDLFFNTPARLKFMKSDRAESAAISAMLGNIALSRPQVSFRYIRDGKEEQHTPGDGRARSAVYTLLGREFAKGLVEVKGQGEGISVEGFVSAPAHVRGSRSRQRFYVNGRYVRSQLLQAALEQAYQNLSPKGKFPGSVLYVTVELWAVDVNVHPAKTEVKFLNERQVFDAVYYSVKDALEHKSYLPEITLSEGSRKALAAPGAANSRPGGEIPRRKAAEPTPVKQPAGAGSGLLQDTAAVVYQSRFSLPESGPFIAPPPARPVPFREDAASPELPPPDSPVTNAGAREKRPPSSPSVCERAASATLIQAEEETESYRVIGEALGTYVLVERGEEILFIDKHAAHERIIFDRLKEEGYTAMAQRLLTPITAELGPEITTALIEQAEYLEQFGFSISQFGQGTLALRQVPGDIDLDDLEAFLTELAEGFRLGKRVGQAEAYDKALHTMACKAAVKAGRRSDPAELHALAEQVLAGAVQYCPHGRPICTVLTRGELGKRVKRQ